MNNCVFAGSFDPLTKGHEKIIDNCIENYDKVFVVLGINPNKTPFFSDKERLEILSAVYCKNEKVKIVDYVNIKDYKLFLLKNNVSVYVRGIRNDADLDYEKKSEEYNKTLYPFVKTVYVNSDIGDVSSSLVRERIKNGQDFSEMVSKNAYEKIIEIIKKR